MYETVIAQLLALQRRFETLETPDLSWGPLVNQLMAQQRGEDVWKFRQAQAQTRQIQIQTDELCLTAGTILKNNRDFAIEAGVSEKALEALPALCWGQAVRDVAGGTGLAWGPNSATAIGLMVARVSTRHPNPPRMEQIPTSLEKSNELDVYSLDVFGGQAAFAPSFERAHREEIDRIAGEFRLAATKKWPPLMTTLPIHMANQVRAWLIAEKRLGSAAAGSLPVSKATELINESPDSVNPPFAAVKSKRKKGLRRGRPSPRDESARTEILSRWDQAKRAGQSQKVFCEDNEISVSHLEKIINWRTTRNRRKK
jgi:hypothetical protein